MRRISNGNIFVNTQFTFLKHTDVWEVSLHIHVLNLITILWMNTWSKAYHVVEKYNISQIKLHNRNCTEPRWEIVAKIPWYYLFSQRKFTLNWFDEKIAWQIILRFSTLCWGDNYSVKQTCFHSQKLSKLCCPILLIPVNFCQNAFNWFYEFL